MKKILLAIGAIVAASQLTACTEDPVKMSFVGTYEMVIPSMGSMGGGHLINFNNDDTIDIYSAFYGMGSAKMDHMEGTYTIDGDDVSIEYSFEDTEYETTFSLTDETFATKIFLGASLPSSDVTYYQIDTLSFEDDSNVAIGSKNVDGKPLAYALEIKKDETFNVSSLINTTKVSLSGDYEVVNGGLDGTDTIEFKYKTDGTDRTQIFDYIGANNFQFNLIHSKNILDTNVTLVRCR